MKKRILIFGTGSVAEVLINEINENAEVVAFVNSNVQVQSFHGYPVIIPEKICEYIFDYILVGSGYYLAIEKLLLDIGVEQAKIVGFIFDEEEVYGELGQALSNYLNERYHRNILKNIIKSEKLYPQLAASVMWKNNCFSAVRKDFVREQTTSLLAQEISRKQIKGVVAELGVFRGDYTVILNKAFPDKKLFLFDTFCGFTENDIYADSEIKNKENELLKFQDTSEEYVLSRLNLENCKCIVKKGWFPDTFDLYEEQFCFVSIDMNVYNPVAKALELFYPRLSEGGYLMISDYNAPFYEGTRQAVIDYCDKKSISMLPIPDLYGSVIICK